MKNPSNVSVSAHALHRKFLYGILVLAAVLRLGAIAVFHSPLVSDEKDYDAMARSIVHGEGIALDGKPTAYRLPGYPLVLAATYVFSGYSDLPVKILQTLFDIVSCLLLFAIGKKVFSVKVGLLAAAVLALFPIQILYVTHLMTETIFTTILLLIVWLAVEDEKHDTRRMRNDLLIGALVGAGVLFRTTPALLPLLILVYRWRLGYSLRANLNSGVRMCFAALLILSPWLVRNYLEFHRVSLTSNGGVNFWEGNHANASGAFSFPDTNNPLAAISDDFQRSDLGFRLGLDFIRSHPTECAVIVGKKFAHFFAADYWLLMAMEYKQEWAHPNNAGSVFRQLSLLNVFILHLPYVIVLLLGTLGLVCPAWKDEKTFFFFRSLLLYWLGVHLIFIADARYRFPVVPIFILAAAYGWHAMRERSFFLTRGRIAVILILCLLYFGGWIGEIVTISRQRIAAFPSSYQVRSKIDPSLSSRVTSCNSDTPNTR